MEFIKTIDLPISGGMITQIDVKDKKIYITGMYNEEIEVGGEILGHEEGEGYNSYIAKFDEEGNKEWVYVIKGKGDIGLGLMEILKDGGVYIVGERSVEVEKTEKIYIKKISSVGEEKWGMEISGDTEYSVIDMAVDSQEDLVVAYKEGEGIVKIEKITREGESRWSYELRCDREHLTTWEGIKGVLEVGDIEIDQDDNILIAGITSCRDPDNSSMVLKRGSRWLDNYMLILDRDGQEILSRRYSNISYETYIRYVGSDREGILRDIIKAKGRDIYTAGVFERMNYDSKEYRDNGEGDIYILKLKQSW